MAFPSLQSSPIPESGLIRSLREYRSGLLAREDAQLTRLATSWLGIEARLNDSIYSLSAQLNDIRQSGGVVSEAAIARLERYKQLRDQVKSEVLGFARNIAIPDIEAEQREFGQSALDIAQRTVSSQLPMTVSMNRLSPEYVETYVGLLGNGSPLYSLIREAYPTALDGIIQTMLEGSAMGKNPVVVAREAARAFGAGLDRMITIARTEQLRVSRIVAADQYRESGVDGRMLRLATKDTETCMACLILDGTEVSLNGYVEDHPRGRCTAVFIVKGSSQSWDLAGNWFERQSEDVQRYMMGDTRFEAWQDGAFSLQDIARVSVNPTWGSSPRVATLAELGVNQE